MLSQQDGQISGVVSDKAGPVIGASVIVKGTTNGITTDMDGRFSLAGLKKGDVIQISYIGYVTQEIKYTGQVSVEVTLKEDAEALDEVVVVGFGTQKKLNLTGAVTAVSGETMTKRPVVNTATMLQGQVPGLRGNSWIYHQSRP